MGAYLDLIKATSLHPNKPKKPQTDSCLGSLGSHLVCFEKFTATQRSEVMRWLDHIGEDDPDVIGDVLHRCDKDADARDYFLWRATAGDA